MTNSLLTKRYHTSVRKRMTSVQQRNQWEQYWLTKLSDNMAPVASSCLSGVHAKQNGNWDALCIHNANGIGRIKPGYTRLSTTFMLSEWACLSLNTHIKTSINKAMINHVKLLRVTQYSERIYQEKLTFIPESTPRNSLYKFYISFKKNEQNALSNIKKQTFFLNMECKTMRSKCNIKFTV